jgi:hypothetical protein
MAMDPVKGPLASGGAALSVSSTARYWAKMAPYTETRTNQWREKTK